MTYHEHLVNLAAGAERQVIAAYRAYLGGRLSHDEAVRYIASAIQVANGKAAALADLAMAAQIMAQLGEAVPVTGVAAPDDIARLERAAATVLATAQASEVPEAIVARLARAEALETAARAAGDAMVRSGRTKGWVRQLSANACQLCRWWWREGRIWPAEHPFQTHKGCTCTPRPVVAEGIKETWRTAREKGIR